MLVLFVAAAKGTLSEETVQLFLRQIGKLTVFICCVSNAVVKTELQTRLCTESRGFTCFLVLT